MKRFSHRKPVNSNTATVSPEERAREDLRRKHGVRPLQDVEEGCGLGRLANGVYGFTYSPGLPECPLFKTLRRNTFEIHKLPDGTAVLIGFVAPEAAGGESMQLTLYPSARENAPKLMAVPLSSVSHFRTFSTREEGGLELRMAPG